MSIIKTRTCIQCKRNTTRSETNICPACRGEKPSQSDPDKIDELAEFYETHGIKNQVPFNPITYQEWKEQHGFRSRHLHSVSGDDRERVERFPLPELHSEGVESFASDVESVSSVSRLSGKESQRCDVFKVYHRSKSSRQKNRQVQRTIFDAIKESLYCKWKESKAKTRFKYWQEVVTSCDYQDCKKGQVGTVVGRKEVGLVVKCIVYFGETSGGNMVTHEMPDAILKHYVESKVDNRTKRQYRRRSVTPNSQLHLF